MARPQKTLESAALQPLPIRDRPNTLRYSDLQLYTIQLDVSYKSNEGVSLATMSFD